MTLSFAEAVGRAPIAAVLRGLHPDEAHAVGDALVSAGIVFLEVTLDSPEPWTSIRTLADAFGASALIAAGTVLRANDVRPAVDAGATMIVAPNFSPAVVTETRAAGAMSCPGVLTPTEAFNALDCGANALKIFPGDMASPKVVKGVRAVLPRDTQLMVTGGVGKENLSDFLAAGANAVGIGSALYAPGKDSAAVRSDAARFVAIAGGVSA